METLPFDMSFIFTVLVQIVSISVIAGIGWTRLAHMERDMLRIEREVADFRSIREDLAVVKSTLSSLVLSVQGLSDMKLKELEHLRMYTAKLETKVTEKD